MQITLYSFTLYHQKTDLNVSVNKLGQPKQTWIKWTDKQNARVSSSLLCDRLIAASPYKRASEEENKRIRARVNLQTETPIKR